MDQNTHLDRLTELTILHRAQLKELVMQLPSIREELRAQIEQRIEQTEPEIRRELEAFVSAKTDEEMLRAISHFDKQIRDAIDATDRLANEKIVNLMAEKKAISELIKKAKVDTENNFGSFTSEVKKLIEAGGKELADETNRQKLFLLQENKTINPLGQWKDNEIYEKLDLVTYNGSSFVANETIQPGIKPTFKSPYWTLIARRGGGGGIAVTTLPEIVGIPADGQLLIGDNGDYTKATLTAGTGIAITNGAGSITVEATGGVAFQGSWNASTNTPTLTSSVGTTGFFYIVSVAGSTNLNGITDWEIGDWAIFGTSTWTKVDNTDKVSSVFGRVGSVVGVSTDYSAVGITNTALGASNPSTVAATTISATSTISATGAVTGSNLSGTNTGDQTNITGNAATATALQTARAINGVNFDGTAAITVTAAGSTLSDTVTIAKGGTGQITAQAALNALLPSQVGATGKNLQSDGTNVSFVADAGGTVTSVSVTTANGVSGTVATSTTTPAISLTLGAITPTSVAASGSVTGSNLSGTNTGDQTITLTGDVTGSGTGSFVTAIGSGVIVDADVNAAAAIAYSKLNLATSIVNADISASAAIVDTKLATISTASKVSNSATTATNANTASAIVARDASGNFSAGTISAALTGNVTGNVSGSSGSTTGNAATATALATGRTIAITGDLAYTSPSFDGSGNVTAAGTLATVATAGSTGSSTAIPIITINAKGLTTSISTAAVVAPAGTLSGNTLASGVTASSLTSLGTIASLTVTGGTISTTPSASTDIANKLYVDTVAQGLDAKASCVAATTANITLSGTQTVDGIVLIAADRVLVKDQTLSQNNGIYLCAAGAWTRTTDADTWDELTSAFTFIESGTVNADTGWVCTANAGGTLGTTALPWSQFSGAGSYTASTGLTLTGTAFSLTTPVAVANGGTGISSFGSGVATFLGTPSSANLASAVTDETGSGALVFATSPTLVTPNIGVATGTSLAAALNGTLGATTPSTVAGTTISASGTIQGNANLAFVADNATGTYSRYKYNSSNRGIIGSANNVISGGSTTDFAIGTENAGNLILSSNNSSIAVISATGLAVTGTTTSSSDVIISSGNYLRLNNTLNSGFASINFDGTNVTSNYGVAITGALSATGAIAIGNTVNTVTATLPNRTVTIVIGGTTYYLHAKTTND